MKNVKLILVTLLTTLMLSSCHKSIVDLETFDFKGNWERDPISLRFTDAVHSFKIDDSKRIFPKFNNSEGASLHICTYTILDDYALDGIDGIDGDRILLMELEVETTGSTMLWKILYNKNKPNTLSMAVDGEGNGFFARE